MVGCCGGGGGGQGVQGAQGAGARVGYQDQSKRRCVTSRHDEEVCHGTNERRRDLLDQVKTFLNDFDERPCQGTPPQHGLDQLKTLGEYQEYHWKHCQSWMPPNPRPPLITSVQTHEVRPTEDYERMQHNNTEYVSYTDARIRPPPSTCECAKRNGLQDECPRPECTPPTPQCLATNPGPCCPPSLGLTREEAARGQRPGYTAPSPPPRPQRQGRDEVATGQKTTSGLRMICFCQESPSNMQSGKKYICCPSPL